MKYTKTEIEESKQVLKDALSKTKGEIWANITSVSRSGMSRNIKLFLIDTTDGHKPSLHNITYHVAIVLGYPIPNNSNGMKTSGCGMDTIFHTIQSLEYALGNELKGQFCQTYQIF